MKTAIIALSAATLIAAPAVLARNASNRAPDQHRQVSKKHLRTIWGYASGGAMHGRRVDTGYPGAFGYAPGEPKDYSLENSRQAGGGGGGGGGSGM